MTAHEIAHYRAPNLNHLRRGWTYTATTRTGATVGEYLGMEADYGERVVLLRSATGVESISRHDLVSIEVAA